MFNVSALLLDDALLKCVVIEVVLFSSVAFKTLTFQKVATHSRCSEIFIGRIIISITDFDSETILKICQYSTKLRYTKQSVPVLQSIV